MRTEDGAGPQLPQQLPEEDGGWRRASAATEAPRGGRRVAQGLSYHRSSQRRTEDGAGPQLPQQLSGATLSAASTRTLLLDTAMSIEHGQWQVATNRRHRGQYQAASRGNDGGHAKQAYWDQRRGDQWMQQPGDRWIQRPDRHSVGSSLALGVYICEGFVSAAHYITDEMLPQCDILFLSEVWLSRTKSYICPQSCLL